jgi:nucleoside phosphorylase
MQDVVMVGIAGAVPNPTKIETHVRLGDVVILGDKGVIQFDFIKLTAGKIEYRHDPRPPSQRLLDAALVMQRFAAAGTHLLDRYLDNCPELYKRPDASLDVLCDGAEAERTDHPHDPMRRENCPKLFVGPIGSSNMLLKDFVVRNRVRDAKGILAIEMESAGGADACQKAGIRFFAVRGTCDYCNQDKGDAWRFYAAYIAAATLHCILRNVPGTAPAVDKATRRRLLDPTSAALLQEHAVGPQPSEARPMDQAVSIPANNPTPPPTQSLPTEGLAQRLPEPASSIPDESYSAALATATDFKARLDRLSAQLDFPEAERLAQECENWLKKNDAILPRDIVRTLYTALALQAFTAERLAAAKIGAERPNHDRSKKFLALARQAIE